MTRFQVHSGIFGILLFAGALHAGPAFPIKLSTGARYTADQNNTPFFWSGDAPWSLIAQVSKADADLYLENRRQKGFSILMVNLIEHKFSSNPPRNFYGDAPFAGTAFSTPNEAYFAHADYVINSAAQKGIAVVLDPLYLGNGCGDEGWCAEVKAASMANLRSWGQYVGNRYKNYDNIVWLIGADADPVVQGVKDRVQEVVDGILDKDTRHIMTAHCWYGFSATPWAGASWMVLNNLYSYSDNLYTECKTAWDRSPIMPYFMIESKYENEQGVTQQQLRANSYWPVLCGGFGYIFGNCPIWHLGATASYCGLTDWKTQLNNQGSVSMDYVQRLFISRAWYLLAPDFNHTVMTAGYGTWGGTDYATTARCSDGSSIIAYIPTSRQVTVDMTKVGGTQAKCWWYKPSNGATTLIGTYAAAGTHAFTPSGSGDWVLVIDNAALNLPAPGTSNITRARDGSPARNAPPILQTTGSRIEVFTPCGARISSDAAMRPTHGMGAGIYIIRNGASIHTRLVPNAHVDTRPDSSNFSTGG
jgi:hypothetical protein